MLSLMRGSLEGTSFHQFINLESCIMTVLKLHAVQGITNESLHALLVAAADTLEEVLVIQCTVTAPEGRKELAFDANMGRMKKLKNAEIQGNIISPLSLARKPACDGSKVLRFGYGCCRIQINGAPAALWEGWRLSADGLPHGDSDYTVSLVNAIEITGWKSIRLVSGGWRDEKHWSIARGVAQRRGIVLQTY
jgi:hypothetical protein